MGGEPKLLISTKCSFFIKDIFFRVSSNFKLTSFTASSASVFNFYASLAYSYASISSAATYYYFLSTISLSILSLSNNILVSSLDLVRVGYKSYN